VQPHSVFRPVLAVRALTAPGPLAATLGEREKRRLFWRNLVGGVIVLATPVLFMLPFFIGHLFGGK
jgi:hypothetical protein